MNLNLDLSQLIDFYQQTIDTFSNEIYVKDNNGVYLIANAFYIKKLIALGITTEDKPSIVGKTDFDLFNKVTATLFYQNDQQLNYRYIKCIHQISSLMN